MKFALSDEQISLRDAARAFLAELPGPHAMTEQDGAYNADAWSRIVGEQGWTSILIPADHGGWGFGRMEMAVVLEEAGRKLTPSPLFSTVALGVTAIDTLGSDAQKAEHLGAIAGGATATLAHEGAVTARRDGDGWLLHGESVRVIDGDTADIVVVWTDAGAFVVAGDAVHRARVPGLDTTRPLATLRFDGLRVSDDARLPGADLDRVLLSAGLLLAAEQVGGAEAVLDVTVDYSKVRKQFGKPIGSFQAIQHACADMLVLVESARSALWYAAWAMDAGAPDAELAVRTAKALASDAYFRNAGSAIQLHGGIGFTWEHVCHLHFKRARAGMALLGEPSVHRAAVAAAMLDGDSAWT
jgi:alkylation response protein AidB-like acyl-CoA dehydrogenase